ncbi:MAG: IS66 family transposase [Hyphomicrobium sp.]
MRIDDLPDDIGALKRLVAERTAERDAAKAGLVTATLEAEKLKFELAKLKRMSFGQSSERFDREIEQLELKLEEIETATADNVPMPEPAATAPEPVSSKIRRKLPEHLPRQTQVHEPASCACPRCGSERLRKVGEDVSEVLTYIPARFEVIRHVRPAYSCSKCEAMTQAAMPALPIPRAMADASVIAHVIMSKYADHLPLYRQSDIFARAGLDLDRGLLADWVGKAAWLVRPLADKIADHVMAGRVIHADDTPVPMLAPGTGKTKTGRLWVYLRDERAHASATPPAVLYRYTPDRKGERCRQHMAAFKGHLHADGYAGFAELYESTDGKPAVVTEVACWAHVRRKIFDVHKSNASPFAKDGLDLIGALFDIERSIAGKPPDHRMRVRQALSKPKLEALGLWFEAQLKLISGKSELAAAIRYALNRWEALVRYADDGRLEISNNAAENAIRPVALGRKNWLFAGSDSGGERAAVFYTLIRSAKLNGLEPEAYLRDVLTRIGEHSINRVDEFLPWAWTAHAGAAKLAA